MFDDVPANSTAGFDSRRTERESPVVIRPLYGPDLRNGFLETLANLSEVNLTPEQAVPVFQRRLREKILTYVAVVDRRVVGTATVIVEPKFLHGGALAGHIEDVAVQAEFQGRGVGKALVQHLVNICRRKGCYKVVLHCDPKLLSFYEGAGFREWARNMRLDLELSKPAA